MRTTLVFTALGLLLASFSFASPAFAETQPTRPEMRRTLQQDYIFTALWEGRLSWKESRVLLAEQDAVSEWFARFTADERLNDKEIRTLDYMFDIASVNIDRALRRHAAATPDTARTPVQIAVAALPTSAP